jgi:spore coat protein A, manganese oxidase
MKRRDFVKAGALAGAALPLVRAGILTRPKARQKRRQHVFRASTIGLTPFVDALPIPPVLPSATNYTVSMSQISQKLHRDLPSTRLFGYNGRYVGPTFEARRGTPINVRWTNNLPSSHFLPVDNTLHGDEPGTPEVRTVVHLHGHKVLPESDGYPEAWFTRNFAQKGPFWVSDTYHYPNDQQSMQLWYHDHALGNTRLNVASGLAGMYFIRDNYEDSLNLPDGPFEIPLMIQDRAFTSAGQIDYPAEGVTAQHPVWIPEYFGDVALVNGKVLPFLDVEPRRYRFRLVNASNARFYNLSLDSGQSFTQIGGDQGFLPAPVRLSTLLLGVAERADVIIDFSRQRGRRIVLTNDAAAPFPDGDLGQVTQIMQFRVRQSATSQDHSSIPSSLMTLTPPSFNSNTRVRDITLVEIADADPPAGTGEPLEGLLENKHWDEPLTINPRANNVEIWRLINTTGDTHPIHVHLVHFFVLDRQPFDSDLYLATGQLQFTGPREAVDPNEANAPKDVVKSPPGFVTRIVQRFELPTTAVLSPGKRFRYVVHCHILEHEDNEMMRPFDVVV